MFQILFKSTPFPHSTSKICALNGYEDAIFLNLSPKAPETIMTISSSGFATLIIAASRALVPDEVRIATSV